MVKQANIVVTILGSGTSHGVPMIGCRCPVCTSTDPRDRRTRASVFVHANGVRILVDTSPELRLQCLANGVDAVDAVLFTHHHADHVVGLDDLRRFNWLMKKPMPCYGTQRTLTALQRMFAYAFESAPDSPHSRPELILNTIDHAPFLVGGVQVTPIPLVHGRMEVLGFRVGRFAYCTDCSEIPDSSFELLQDLDVLVLDALRKRAHPAHFNLAQAIAVSTLIGARQTYFTHIAHELKHDEINSELPPGMALAHDGLVIEIDDESSNHSSTK